jgi:hypothetical protein
MVKILTPAVKDSFIILKNVVEEALPKKMHLGPQTLKPPLATFRLLFRDLYCVQFYLLLLPSICYNRLFSNELAKTDQYLERYNHRENTYLDANWH